MIATVILLNWNGWKDTIECLESLFRLSCPSFRVVVCDNASSNGSFERIKEWARGTLPASSAVPELARFVSPPIRKPINFRELTRDQAESQSFCDEEQLVLVQNGANLGFAGGCNVGLRYALHDQECRFFWLLNNDTVVEPESLSAIINLMQQRSDVGLCGSLNMSYYRPKEVQAKGGKRYSRWTGRVRNPPIRNLEEIDLARPEPIDFVIGASMLASRQFLEVVGLMEESYFLNFEELDWAARAKGRFTLGYCSQSVIYHKEGASIGSNVDRTKRSLLSDEYLSYSRVLFTKRFFPWALPTVMTAVCLAALHRLCSGDSHRARTMLASMLRGLAART